MKQRRARVAVGLAPDGFGLGLDAADAAEDHDRAVEHAERPLDLGGEVHVAGRVDQVDEAVAPFEVVAAEVMVMPRRCSSFM